MLVNTTCARSYHHPLVPQLLLPRHTSRLTKHDRSVSAHKVYQSLLCTQRHTKMSEMGEGRLISNSYGVCWGSGGGGPDSWAFDDITTTYTQSATKLYSFCLWFQYGNIKGIAIPLILFVFAQYFLFLVIEIPKNPSNHTIHPSLCSEFYSQPPDLSPALSTPRPASLVPRMRTGPSRPTRCKSSLPSTNENCKP